MLKIFSQLNQIRTAIDTQVVANVMHLIDTRPPGLRDQTNDDLAVFGPLNTAMIMAAAQQDYQMAKAMFVPCYGHALEYERTHLGSEIHKGAPTFNMGLVCLRSYDFSAAMQYFELAEDETQKTTGVKDWNIFLSELFDTNFWDTVETARQQYPIPLYHEFWKAHWGKLAAKRNWRRVSASSKLLFLINIAQRIRYKQLISQSHFPESRGLSLSYWNLCADLSRLLETEVSRRAKPAPASYKLYNILTQGFTATVHGNISAAVAALYGSRKVNNTTSFNMHFPAIRSDIENATLPMLTQLSNAVYLLYATRNQVQHHVDNRMILYKDPETAAFTADVLLTLCRLDSWTK